MDQHFDNHLNLRKLILESKPKVIVECGAGEGATTKLLAHMKWYYDFDLYSITDKALEGEEWMTEVEWKIGLSYERLADFEDGSIDLLIIDTDHNWWTLTKELEAASPKVKEGGFIVFHDVETFYHNTGMAMSYWNNQPYPEEEIKAYARYGGVGDALINFLAQHKNQWKLLFWTQESDGAALIQKHAIANAQIVMPGTQPVFAKAIPV